MTEESEQGATGVINWDVNTAAIQRVAEEMRDIDAYQDLDAAKAAKKKLVKMRTTLSEAHKETKAEALAFGRKVDAKKNEYLAQIREIEDPISEALDEIKNAAAKKEEERVAKIMAELERIQAYALDRHSLTLDELEARLSNLRDQVIDADFLEEYAEDGELAQQEADLKLRLAIDRETQEQADREEKERIEAENQELRDKLAKAEEEEEERKAIRDREEQERRAEQDKKDRERQEELDEQQAALDKEKQDIEDAAEAERQREQKAEEEREAQQLRDLQAPDVDKLTKYAEAIDHLIGLKPVMGSNAGASALLDVLALLIDSHDVAKKNIEDLKS